MGNTSSNDHNIVYTYEIVDEIPEGIPPGEYRMRIGFYDGLGRLPLADGTTDHYTLDRVLHVQKP